MGSGFSCEFAGEIRLCVRCNRELFMRSEKNLCRVCDPNQRIGYGCLRGGRCNACHTHLEHNKLFCNSSCRDRFLKEFKCKICLQVVTFETKQCSKCLTKIENHSNILFRDDLARLAGVNLCKYCGQVFSKSSFDQEFCGSKCESANTRSYYTPSHCGLCGGWKLRCQEGACFNCRTHGAPKPDPPPKCPPISRSTSTSKKTKKKKKVILINRYGRTIYRK